MIEGAIIRDQRYLLGFDIHFGNIKLPSNVLDLPCYLSCVLISVLDVDSVVIEKPKISTDELNELLAEMAQKQSPDKMDKCVTEEHASDDNSEENYVPGIFINSIQCHKIQ